MKKILLIGCGHMGSSLLKSWIDTNKYNLTVIDPLKKKLIKKYKTNKINFLEDILLLKKNDHYEFVVLAVRPTDLNRVLNALSIIKISKTSSIISVIAGKKIKIFKKKLINNKNFFRVMPNMPAAIRKSMNCIVSTKGVTKAKQKEVAKLFENSGKTLFLKNENEIDMATAISGSGPGFVFNIIDAMINAATKLGFEQKIANVLVSQTFKGSVDLFINGDLSAKDLVKKVATKGGTTEAGLNIMKKNKLHEIFVKLTRESYKRAKFQGK